MGTRGQWAVDFLHALGNANPSDNTISFVAAWTAAENTEAHWNPLATTLPYGNHTDFNPGGVKNYSSREEGIAASVATITENHFGYAKLRESLRANDVNGAITSAGLDTWGSKTAHVLAIYTVRDTRSDMLKSETGRESSGREQPRPSAGAPPGAGPGPSISPGGGPQQPTPDPSQGVDAQFVRNVGKTMLGISMIGFGLMLIAVNLVFSKKSVEVIGAVAGGGTGRAVRTAAKIAS